MNPLSTAKRALRKITSAAQSDEAAAAAGFWDQQVTATSVYWAEHGKVREYVNECITGVGWLWPVVALKAGWAYKPLNRGLSIGCGSGNLERALRLLNVCKSVLGLDVSKTSIKEAKRLAREEDIDHVRYKVADCNVLRLPREHYDGVFFHGSLHHISDPDTLLAEVSKTLRPHGLLFIDDYVGPSRDEWTDDDLKHARAVYETVPDDLKVVPVNPPLDWRDPSEMIRSSRILPAFHANFEELHYRPYWGNLLFPLLCALDGQKLLKPENQHWIEKFVAEEKRLVASGEITRPLFAVLLGRRRT